MEKKLKNIKMKFCATCTFSEVVELHFYSISSRVIPISVDSRPNIKMTDTSESKSTQEINDVVSEAVAEPVTAATEVAAPVVDAENTEKKTDEFIRTRKGDSIGSTAKRQRLLKKEPDTWVCFMIMCDGFKMIRFSFLEPDQRFHDKLFF